MVVYQFRGCWLCLTFGIFVALKTRSVKTGLDHQTKNPLKEDEEEKMGMAEGKNEKNPSVTIKYIDKSEKR